MKEKITNYVKLAVLLLTTLLGFFTIYAVAWVQLGLPIAWWSTLIVITLSCLSEHGFIKRLED